MHTSFHSETQHSPQYEMRKALTDTGKILFWRILPLCYVSSLPSELMNPSLIHQVCCSVNLMLKWAMMLGTGTVLGHCEKLPSFACLGGSHWLIGLILHWIILPFFCLLVFSNILFFRYFGPGHFITWNLLVFYLSIICYWQIILLKPTKNIPLTLCALTPLCFSHVNNYVDLKRTSE